MIDIMCDRLHLPAIIFTFCHLPILRPPSYYSGLRSTRGKLGVHSIKSRAHNIGFSSSSPRLLRLPRHAAVVVVELCCLVGWVGLGWSMHGHEVPYIGLFSATAVVASLHITWAVCALCVCVPGGRCFYNFGLQSLYYAQPVQIALDCTVAQQQRWTTVSFFCFFIVLLLLLREIHLRRFVVFEWTDPVLCNTHDTICWVQWKRQVFVCLSTKKLEAGFSIQRSLITTDRVPFDFFTRD